MSQSSRRFSRHLVSQSSTGQQTVTTKKPECDSAPANHLTQGGVQTSTHGRIDPCDYPFEAAGLKPSVTHPSQYSPRLIPSSSSISYLEISSSDNSICNQASHAHTGNDETGIDIPNKVVQQDVHQSDTKIYYITSGDTKENGSGADSFRQIVLGDPIVEEEEYKAKKNVFKNPVKLVNRKPSCEDTDNVSLIDWCEGEPGNRSVARKTRSKMCWTEGQRAESDCRYYADDEKEDDASLKPSVPLLSSRIMTSHVTSSVESVSEDAWSDDVLTKVKEEETITVAPSLPTELKPCTNTATEYFRGLPVFTPGAPYNEEALKAFLPAPQGQRTVIMITRTKSFLKEKFVSEFVSGGNTMFCLSARRLSAAPSKYIISMRPDHQFRGDMKSVAELKAKKEGNTASFSVVDCFWRHATKAINYKIYSRQLMEVIHNCSDREGQAGERTVLIPTIVDSAIQRADFWTHKKLKLFSKFREGEVENLRVAKSRLLKTDESYMNVFSDTGGMLHTVPWNGFHQLAAEEEGRTVWLEMRKSLDKNVMRVDYTYPLCAIQALAFGLSVAAL